MTGRSDSKGRVSVLPMPKSFALIWLNIGLSLVVAAIGLGVGFAQEVSAQRVILFTILTATVLFLLLNYIVAAFEANAAARAEETEEEQEDRSGRARKLWRNNRVLIIAMAAVNSR